MVRSKRLVAALVAVLLAPTPFAACGCAPDFSPPEAAPEARRYRNLTKHTPESVRSSRHRLVWTNKPTLYRDYPDAETVRLPAPRRLAQAALEAIAAASAADTDGAPSLDLQLLGTILFLTGGISGSRPSSGGDIRTTAAAGALYPNEIYAVTGDLPGLPAGVYHYNPKEEHLSRLRAGDWRGSLAAAATDGRIRTAPATIVITGILWRSAWKYGERAYRHLYWDGGMMLAHLLAAAGAGGQPAKVLASFIDADVDRLVGADGRREKTLAVVPLGMASSENSAPRVPGRPVLPPPLVPTALSKQPIDYPGALRYHAASSLGDTAAVRETRKRRLSARRTGRNVESVHQLPPSTNARGDPTLDGVIRRRRSTRRFGARPISLAELSTILERTMRGFPADFLGPHETLLHTYLIVSAVRDLEPGAYHYNRESHQLELLKAGDFRKSAGFLCLDQALAHDASAVVYYLSDLEAIGRTFGERGYRFAELEAGLVAGRAYLAAHAVGRGATGLTFYDDEVSRFFSPHAAGLEPLLVVAVGVPAPYRPRSR